VELNSICHKIHNHKLHS